MVDKLAALGWNDRLQKSYSGAPLDLARVTGHTREYLELLTPSGLSLKAKLLGKWRSKSEFERPGVGDWVSIELNESGRNRDEALIKELIPRYSYLSRVASGFETKLQMMAANVDYALLVTSPNDDFSPRRLERFIAICQQGSVQPVVVVSKADLINDLSSWRAALTGIDTNIPIHFVSIYRPESIDTISALVSVGKTAILLGSSGVGKSSLINLLLGEDLQKTQKIREKDSKGRHTTTKRSLHFLKSGGMIIDTPGIRELKVSVAPENLLESFSDIEALAHQCKFTNCHHQTEPGCKVKLALNDGKISQERYDSYQKLSQEVAQRIKKSRGY